MLPEIFRFFQRKYFTRIFRLFQSKEVTRNLQIFPKEICFHESLYFSKSNTGMLRGILRFFLSKKMLIRSFNRDKAEMFPGNFLYFKNKDVPKNLLTVPNQRCYWGSLNTVNVKMFPVFFRHRQSKDVHRELLILLNSFKCLEYILNIKRYQKVNKSGQETKQ